MSSSLSFAGTNSSNIVIPYSTDLDFGTGEFTIEWYQYQTDTNLFPRPFARGTASPPAPPFEYETIGVSIEESQSGGRRFYLWTLDSIGGSMSIESSPPRWIHFAIVRSGTTTTVYMNGVSQFSFTDLNDYYSEHNLTIGNETIPSDDNAAAFGGYMAYFSYNKGYARYTTPTFTVSNTYPPVVASTVIMVNAAGAYGSLASSAIYSEITTVPETPFVTPPSPSGPPIPYSQMVQSLFANNTRVYYKPNSLAWSIGSTVRNSRAVSKRT